MIFNLNNQNTRLFYLFSSDASPRYKRNVLDILCYPEGHIFRLRYQSQYVSKKITEWRNIKSELKKGRQGILIYAETMDKKETAESFSHQLFNFFPTREVEIIQVKIEGSVYYVDVKLGKFLVQSDRQTIENKINILPLRPLPPLRKKVDIEYGKTWDITNPNSPALADYNLAKTGLDTPTPSFTEKTQGSFLSFTDERIKNIKILLESSKKSSDNSAWENTIDTIDKAPGMKRAIFYRVLGFYEYKRLWNWLWLRKGEVKKKLKNENLNTVYSLPIGRTAFLKMLFYKSEDSWKEVREIRKQILEIKTEGEAFAGFSQKTIPILSRYNEEVIQIACKRVFDSVFAPISIELKTKDENKDVVVEGKIINPQLFSLTPKSQTKNVEILAPQPYLVTKISVPNWVKILLLVFTVLASVFLTFSPDIFMALGETPFLKDNHKTISEVLIYNKGFFSALFKVIGTVFAFAAAFLAFRKLPIGGK